MTDMTIEEITKGLKLREERLAKAHAEGQEAQRDYELFVRSQLGIGMQVKIDEVINLVSVIVDKKLGK